MTSTPVKYPQMGSQTVAAHRRLGRGLRFLFEVAGEAGELLLEPGQGPGSGVSLSFESGCGVMTFTDAGAILSLFGECPVVLANTGNDPDSWFWAFFQQRMSPQLLGLFSYLQPLADVQPSTFECRVSVVLGPSRSVGRLRMAPEVLLALHDAGPWQAIKAPLPELFPVSVAVVLGSLQLAVEQLRTLHSGDVVVLERLQFTADGCGQLSIGRLRLGTQINDEGGYRRLSVGSIEEVAMDDIRFASTEVEGEDTLHDEPFEPLLLDLSVRCGTLRLSLGELRQLAPGVVLSIEGYGVGMAGLYYGDRPIGHGQLVEVDGRLGLQLSRVMLTQ